MKFNTKDRIVDFMSLAGNNLIPTSIAIGEKNPCLLSDYCKYIENDRIEERTFLNSTDNSVHPFDSHSLNCGQNVFKEI